VAGYSGCHKWLGNAISATSVAEVSSDCMGPWGEVTGILDYNMMPLASIGFVAHSRPYREVAVRFSRHRAY
jgi:hypothetical protein